MTTDHAPPLSTTTTTRPRPPAWRPPPRHRPRSLTTDHGDNPLPATGMATAPALPAGPAGDDDDRSNDCHQRYPSTATLPSIAALSSPRAHGEARVLLTCLHLLRSTPPTTCCARIATRRRWHFHSSSCTRTCPQPRRHTPPPALAQHFSHVHAPAAAFFAAAFFAQGWSCWSSLHRVGVVGGVATHAQEQRRYCVPQPCSARSNFLVSGFCPSLAGTRFSSYSQRASPRQHARTRRARTDDRRRTTRRAVRRRTVEAPPAGQAAGRPHWAGSAGLMARGPVVTKPPPSATTGANGGNRGGNRSHRARR